MVNVKIDNKQQNKTKKGEENKENLAREIIKKDKKIKDFKAKNEGKTAEKALKNSRYLEQNLLEKDLKKPSKSKRKSPRKAAKNSLKNTSKNIEKYDKKVQKIAIKTSKKFTKKEKFFLILAGSVIGFLNGFFGGGGGMICVPMLQNVLKLDAKQSHATAILVIFPLSLISAFIYVINGYISSLPLLTVGLGVVAGGILGSFALKFLPPKAVRVIFAIIMFVGGIKLII